MQVKYKRVVLKLSGEALAGSKGTGHRRRCPQKCRQTDKGPYRNGRAGCLRGGGGNIWRGAPASMGRHGQGHSRLYGHAGHCNKRPGVTGCPGVPGVTTRTQTAIEMRQVAEPYIRRRAIRHLERAGWSSLPPEPETLTFLQIQPPLCALRNWRLT